MNREIPLTPRQEIIRRMEFKHTATQIAEALTAANDPITPNSVGREITSINFALGIKPTSRMNR